MAIHYDNISDASKLQVADILSKREAVEGTLADIQTERATAELARKGKEQSLKAELNKLTEEVRKIRKATLTV